VAELSADNATAIIGQIKMQGWFRLESDASLRNNPYEDAFEILKKVKASEKSRDGKALQKKRELLLNSSKKAGGPPSTGKEPISQRVEGSTLIPASYKV